MKIQKKMGGGGSGRVWSGGGGGSGWGGDQGRCEQRSEVFVKIKKICLFFGGEGGGGVRSGGVRGGGITGWM